MSGAGAGRRQPQPRPHPHGGGAQPRLEGAPPERGAAHDVRAAHVARVGAPRLRQQQAARPVEHAQVALHLHVIAQRRARQRRRAPGHAHLDLHRHLVDPAVEAPAQTPGPARVPPVRHPLVVGGPEAPQHLQLERRARLAAGLPLPALRVSPAAARRRRGASPVARHHPVLGPSRRAVRAQARQRRRLARPEPDTRVVCGCGCGRLAARVHALARGCAGGRHTAPKKRSSRRRRCAFRCAAELCAGAKCAARAAAPLAQLVRAVVL